MVLERRQIQADLLSQPCQNNGLVRRRLCAAIDVPKASS